MEAAFFILLWSLGYVCYWLEANPKVKVTVVCKKKGVKK
jgi:hypothetical protein